LLSVKNICLNYGGIRAVDDMSLEVGQGEIVGLIGTNGAGKTSLFNVITGFSIASSGSVAFEGEDLTRWLPWQIAEAGMVRTFQTPLGFPRMTVVENMLVFAPEERVASTSVFGGQGPSRDLLDRVMSVLGDFDLNKQANLWVGDLSAPELKMLELARVMMASPKIMLLDEPAAGVNPALMERTVSQIRSLRDQGVTFLVVDHNLGFILQLCERTYAMAHGQLIASGDTRSVIDDPEVIRIYIGSDFEEEKAMTSTK
jgi:ABC-type branched-subunit amino acid transport system ATPase component